MHAADWIVLSLWLAGTVGVFVILFQGDSITDAGRKKDRAMPNDSEALGNGYPAMIC